MTKMPDTHPVAVQDLQLGDALIQAAPNGGWSEGIVYYLAEHTADIKDKGIAVRRMFAVAPRRVVRDRLLNWQKYRLQMPPLSPFAEFPLDDEIRASKPNPQGHVRTTLTLSKPKKKVELLPLLRAKNRERLFFNQLTQDDLQDQNLNLRALRHAARTLTPGIQVDFKSFRGEQETRVLAVAIGIHGPLSFLPRIAPIRLFNNPVRDHIMASDLWIDAADATIAVLDPQRNNATIKNIDIMQHVTVPHA